MAMNEALLAEFDHEMAVTRRLLDRVPADRLGWKPHARSMSMGRLATHLSEIPAWSVAVISGSSFNITGDYLPRECASIEEVLRSFDSSVAETRAALARISDAELGAPWSLLKDGQEVFSLPRVAALRGFLFSHVVHHRGQLSVYLRMNDVPLPAIYGPSADQA
jgi:uncharacterized damage-inducible protein DinB